MLALAVRSIGLFGVRVLATIGLYSLIMLGIVLLICGITWLAIWAIGRGLRK